MGEVPSHTEPARGLKEVPEGGLLESDSEGWVRNRCKHSVPGNSTPQLLAHGCPQDPEEASGTQSEWQFDGPYIPCYTTAGLLRSLHDRALYQGVGGMN